jgi:large subunit ribosomal protein L1
MPNVKSGTLVKPDDLIETFTQSKQGLIEFRVNENAFIMGKFGKRDFPDENLNTNLDAFIKAVAHKRPVSIKGKYLSYAVVKSSMGPTVKLDLSHYQTIGGAN